MYKLANIPSISTIAMSIARLVTIFNTDFSDLTSNTYIFTWSMIEFGVAIQACCIPLLRPVFVKLIPYSTKAHRDGAQRLNDQEPFRRLDDVECGALKEGGIPLQHRGLHNTTTFISATDLPIHGQHSFSESP